MGLSPVEKHVWQGIVVLDTSMLADPFVTVILLIRNEAALIARCLRAVLPQDYPTGKA